MSAKSTFFSHGRRIALEIVNAVFGNRFVLKAIGFLNRRYHFLESIFLVYPAERKYTLAFVYLARAKVIRWTPWFIGILFQNGKLMLMFAISASDDDLWRAPNERLKSVCDKMSALQELVGAKQKTFAGILPGVLFRRTIVTDTPEADLTARVVAQAIDLVLASEGLASTAPIIVLGGHGFIGSRVVATLRAQDRTVCAIDQDNASDWPETWRGAPAVLVNITRRGELDKYLEMLWPGIVILNEVYPEPPQKTLSALRARGCACYHVMGVAGLAVPRFPSVYEGAIPCCAAWPAPSAEARIRKLV